MDQHSFLAVMPRERYGLTMLLRARLPLPNRCPEELTHYPGKFLGQMDLSRTVNPDKT